MAGPPKGIEARLIAQARAAFAGESIDPREVPSHTTPGLSPNQLALALAVNYATATGVQFVNAGTALTQWLSDQARAFMRREQGGYRGYFEVAMAVVVKFAWLRSDAEIYRYALRWWLIYVTYCSRCSVGGRVYLPGPRQGQPHDQGPWNPTRDWCTEIADRIPPVLPNPDSFPATEEYIAPRMLVALRRDEQLPLTSPADAYLPNLRDPMRIRRWPAGICVEVETFWPEGWENPAKPPVEGAPVWSCVVDNSGNVIDMVSWRTVAEIRGEVWTWQQVAHANIAGYKAPRPPHIPAAWGEPTYDVLLGDSGSIPPLPPLPANWRTAPAPPPEEDPGPKDAEIYGWSVQQLNDAVPEAWGGHFREDWEPARMKAIEALDELRETLVGWMHRKPNLRKGLRRPKR